MENSGVSAHEIVCEGSTKVRVCAIQPNEL